MTDQLINEAVLRRRIEPHGFDCIYREQTQSTNIDVLEHFDQTQRQVVAVAESQAAGRGRRGREWLSPFARNIYCTIGLRKRLDVAQQGLLSIVTGVALCRILRELLEVRISLKWPNDLLFEESKLGGILIEARPLSEDEVFFAIGFGLNVFMDKQALSGIPQAATSLQLISQVALDRDQILIECIESVIAEIQDFGAEKTGVLKDYFRYYDAFRDKPVEVITPEGPVNGLNRGINDEGQLLLETEGGISAYSSAEISLKAAHS